MFASKSSQAPVVTVLSRESGQGLVEYALILSLVAIVLCGVFACIAFLAWPWIVSVLVPWLGTVIAGVQAGNPTSIAILVLLVLFVLWLFLRRR